METDNLNRFEFLGVRLDFPSDETLEAYSSVPDDGRNRQVCFVTLRAFLKARRGGEFGSLLAGSDLALPVSPTLAAAAAKAGARGARSYDSLRVLVKFLSALELRNGAIYLAGSKPSILAKTEANLKSTFPGLRIVGRYAGPWSVPEARSAFEAIRKATPNLLLAGSGLPGGEIWLSRQLPEFRSGLFVWDRRILETLAGKVRKPFSGERKNNSCLHEYTESPTAPFRVVTLLSFVVTRYFDRKNKR